MHRVERHRELDAQAETDDGERERDQLQRGVDPRGGLRVGNQVQRQREEGEEGDKADGHDDAVGFAVGCECVEGEMAFVSPRAGGDRVCWWD